MLLSSRQPVDFFRDLSPVCSGIHSNAESCSLPHRKVRYSGLQCLKPLLDLSLKTDVTFVILYSPDSLYRTCALQIPVSKRV